MKLANLVGLIACAGMANAFFRMRCHSRLTLDQIDPIVNPGEIPATHVHTIMGGNNFHPSCNGTSLAQSSCTSCQVRGDGSAYWVPALYFETEGKFHLVPQKDMLVYYLPERERALGEVKQFPKDFRMLAGDPKIRSYPGTVEATEDNRRQRAIGFNCMNYDLPPKGFLEVNTFPDRKAIEACKDGLRAEIAFPNCWNGVDSDSPDHRSHVAYPENVQGGKCPDSHPHRIISILYETMWDVAAFNGKDGRFVWSHADPTGFGYHGDFMFGWEDGLLERVSASAKCTEEKMTGGVMEECDVFVNENRLQSNEEMEKCSIAPFVPGADFSQPMAALPGCPMIEDGPAYATGCHSAGAANPNTYKQMPEAPKEYAAEPEAPAAPAAPVEPAAPAYVAPQEEAKPKTSKCSNGKQPIKRGDKNVVWYTETVTETTTAAYAKRSAHKHMHRKRHGNRL